MGQATGVTGTGTHALRHRRHHRMSASLRWLRWMPSCTVDAHRMRTSARDARGAMLREQTYLPQPGSQSPACPVDAMAICQPQVDRDGNEGSRQNGENCTRQQDVTLQPFRATPAAIRENAGGTAHHAPSKKASASGERA